VGGRAGVKVEKTALSVDKVYRSPSACLQRIYSLKERRSLDISTDMKPFRALQPDAKLRGGFLTVETLGYRS
jgi:hypothetical protein